MRCRRARRGKGKSVDECLLEARMVKANKIGGRWECCNLIEGQRRLFESLNTSMSVETLLPHT